MDLHIHKNELGTQTLRKVLTDLREGRMTIGEIAHRHQVSQRTVEIMAEQLATNVNPSTTHE